MNTPAVNNISVNSSAMDNLGNAGFEMPPFFLMTPDLVCIADKSGFFKKVNHSVIEKLGYTEQELLSRPISSFIHPADKELTRQERTKLLNDKVLLNFQNRYITKTGKTIWLDWTSIYFSDQEVVFAIAKDVTERKRIEEGLEEEFKKFKNLASFLKTSIEKDKKYLAIELHEELAQLASVVKMDLDWINENTPGLPVYSKNRMVHASAVSALLVKAIRRISFSVSPNMLDDFGLNETLRWLCKEFTILNGIPCHFESSCDEMGLTKEIQLDFFRICQEALANIMHHAQASEVRVGIRDIDDKILLSVTDDGQGFDTEQQEQTPGIMGMRERANSINGQLTIQSAPGQGTEVCVTITRQFSQAPFLATSN